MARPTVQERAVARAVLNYLGSSSDHSEYAVAAELRLPLHSVVKAETERCAKLFDDMEGEGLLLGANEAAEIIRWPAEPPDA